ncbi:DMT family transporter [Fictibacillus sp. BK138]|jgi:drug/metabolite transporter (DMT)-like permease|uniref:DMT family transporter n=1 Tax=Fictibacillus sp. BK138 TaxID=2512121 RepID=UPI0010D43200|nr:DMT family transporter [Fictibacillus sp. BK138]RZT22780.1 EamA-like transporter family protein [Fictibacillus sp. BK138]
MIKKPWFADFNLLLVAFVWGTTFVIVQKAIAFLEPYSFNTVRFFIAAILLLFIIYFFKRSSFQEFKNKSLLKSGMLLGFWLFLGYGFQTVGLLYTTSSKAGFITGLSVVLVPLFSYVLLKQKLNWQIGISSLLAVAGLYLLTIHNRFSLNIGDGYVLLCAVSFALHIVFTGKFAKSFDALCLTVLQLFTVSFLSFITAFFTERWQEIFAINMLLKSEVITALLITSLFATALAFLAQTYFQSFTTPARVALIFAMEPVFAAITAFIVLNERLGSKALFGCILILFGMILSELKYSDFTFKKKTKRVGY